MSGFGDTQTVFLARATLARTQQELGLATDDVAMALRGPEGDIDVQRSPVRDDGSKDSATYWDSLAGQVFTSKSSAGTAAEATSGKCDTPSIDPIQANRAADKLRLCEAALLVRTRGLSQREKVLGLLRGFNAQLTRMTLEH